jgi:hypothetical protein
MVRCTRRGGGQGRPRSAAKELFWREHVTRQGAGRLSVRDYCERHSLGEPSFYLWRRELARRDQVVSPSATQAPTARGDSASGGGRSARTVEFVRLDAGPELSSASRTIEIVLPSKVRIRVPSGATRGQMREVLAALGVKTDGEAQSC